MNFHRTCGGFIPRNYLTCLLAVLLTMISMTAGGQGFNYQAKLTDSFNQPLTGAHTLYFGLYTGGTATEASSGVLQYSETAVVSADNGVVSFQIGTGTPTFGTLTPLTFLNSGPYHLQVAVDDVASPILPRTELAAVPYALLTAMAKTSMGLTGAAYILVQTTDSEVENAQHLDSAYNDARFLTPHGLPLSPYNRAVVLVPPGRYDFGTGLLGLNTDYVDLIGLSSDSDDQYIFGTSNGVGSGVLHQSAMNVRIANLTVHCTRSSGGAAVHNTSPAAYFPDSGRNNTHIKNCTFLADDVNAFSMRVGITYNGSFVDCTAGSYSFGGGTGGIASGTFFDCIGGAYSFGGNGLASGLFARCIGAVSSFARDGTASGMFISCTAGDDSFASSGTASGYFFYCMGGDRAFAGGVGGSAAGGRFYYCRGNTDSFTAVGAPVHLYCCRGNAEYP